MTSPAPVIHLLPLRLTPSLLLIAAVLLLPAALRAEGNAEPGAPSQGVTHRVWGLFAPDREQDLQRVMQQIPDIRLKQINYETAEARFEYDPAEIFPGAKPEQIIQRFDTLLRRESNHTFGIQPLSTVPREKLEKVEVGVVGLDCKACSFAAWQAVARLEGVERATASFHDGLVTVWIDPRAIDRAAVEEALQQKGVELAGK